MSNQKEAETKIVDAIKEAEKAAEKLLPRIRRGRYDQLIIYEVSQRELEILAQGSPNLIYLNFAISLLSVSISFIIALLTTTITSNRVFTVFVVIAVVGIISGLVLLFLWLKTRKSVSDLIKTIKNRLPEENSLEAE